jgi:excinuclease ABC subunit B
MTGSMMRAIEETDRRRHKQETFNELHHITPRSIEKAIHNILESDEYETMPSSQRYLKVAEEQAKFEVFTPQQLSKKIKVLEDKMYQHAKNLEFEQAAGCRDEIRTIQNGMIGIKD